MLVVSAVDTDLCLGETDWLDSPGHRENPDYTPLTQDHTQYEWVRKIVMVHDSQLPNKDGCRIQVNHTWNFDLLQQLLLGYHDQQIVELLKFGFPIDRNMDVALELFTINHKGATQFESAIDDYIQKELELGAMIGLFDNIPFRCPVAISPLSSRPKKESAKHRIIMDCSWPIGMSLNDGIDKDKYLGNPTNLKYPTIDVVCRHIHNMHKQRPDRDIFLFHKDLDRAFRQLFADLKDVPLLGFRWRNRYYFNLVMVMGCRIAPYICQRTMSMIAYIHSLMSFFLLNYVDDFLGIEYVDKIYNSHRAFVALL